MAADDWVMHDKATFYLGDGTVDLDGDSFKMGLALSTSNVGDVTVDGYATVTNEHATANGYTLTGITLTNVTWTEAAGLSTFDCDDVTWTAAGGSITARYAFIYDDTAAGKPVMCHSLLDNTPGDVTATDGNTFNVLIDAAGVFTCESP